MAQWKVFRDKASLTAMIYTCVEHARIGREKLVEVDVGPQRMTFIRVGQGAGASIER
jgi:hypothetical protein